MQKKFIVAYLMIVFTLLTMMSLSRYSSEVIRGEVIAFLAPVWKTVLQTKHFFLHPTQPSPFTTLSKEEENLKLQAENQLLLTELNYLKQLLSQQNQLSQQVEFTASAAPETIKFLSKESNRAVERTLKQVKWRLSGVPARVIFRTFDTWNSSLWLNVGKATNQQHHTQIVAKNSPVVIGQSIVGVIDYVCEHQSRVRLISDPTLTPSVRVSRGGEHDLLLSYYLDGLLEQLNHRITTSLSPDEQIHLTDLLVKIKTHLKPFKKSWYLAKGELSGSPSSCRSNHTFVLKGTGFNYDFDDEEGVGRDLRTGKPLKGPLEEAIPLLKINDILVTTGMDGIFPPGFQVGTISKIELLKEGDYFYTIEAKPIAGPLEELNLVVVLPPFEEGSPNDPAQKR